MSAQGYRFDHSITDVISRFPTPSNQTELRPFFGLVNQLFSSTNVVATLLTPICPLLSTKNDFLWSPDHQQVIDAVKNALLTLILASPPAYPQMLAAMALASYCNKTLQALETLFRQALIFSLTLNPDIQSSNLKCWPCLLSYLQMQDVLDRL